MSDEEVRRVFEALDAVEAITDPEARSRAQSQVTAEVRERSSRWMKERTTLANRIKQEEGEKATIRGLSKRLGVAPGTVQDMLDGYRGSGQRRSPTARRKGRAAESPPEPDQP
ncbi:hypothetical protein AB0912_15515 [Streptomyces sp. NPDC007084]|uniref:hypothetical protein n=1 Tax=Streptomyces sp. NPDC007084 TaxID=3154313 RepID=UPI003451DB01